MWYQPRVLPVLPAISHTHKRHGPDSKVLPLQAAEFWPRQAKEEPFTTNVCPCSCIKWPPGLVALSLSGTLLHVIYLELDVL